MIQLHQNFEAQSVHFNVKPDYGSLLSKKFSSFHDEVVTQPEENLPADSSADKKENDNKHNRSSI